VTVARRIASSVGLATVAFVVVYAAQPFTRGTIVAAYAIGLAAIASAELARAMREARQDPPSRFARELLRARQHPGRPNQLIRVSRELTLGTQNAGHYHSRLLPLLRDAAAARLESRHRIDLVRQPEAARRLLGDDAWQLIRPDRPEPDDVYAPGPPLRAVGRLVDAVERL
jgi:hypothetical protein